MAGIGIPWQAFELDELARQREDERRAYLEFLRAGSMSAGLYVLPAGGVDPQQPHREDELYFVVSGAAVLEVAGEQQSVRAGSAVFVAAGISHRFHSISRDLTVLVFFAPAESAPAPRAE